MTCIVVAITVAGMRESELPAVYGKKTFGEKVFKATEGSLMAITKSGAMEPWYIPNQN